MSYAPATITAVRAYLKAITGDTQSGNFGINRGRNGKGRRGYHFGLDLLLEPTFDHANGKGDGRLRDYSLQAARDTQPVRALGLTVERIWRARQVFPIAGTLTAAQKAAAEVRIALRLGITVEQLRSLDGAHSIDIKRPGKELRALSTFLVAECQAGRITDMREVIYSDDGKRVLRYDRERGQSSAPRTGEADASHTWHTHISWYRDAEAREKVTPFRRFYEPTQPEPEEPVNSEDVKDVQRAMNELGTVPALKVDGHYGPLTRAAVKGIAERQATRFEATAEAAAYRVRTAKDAALVSIEQQAESIKQAAKAAQG
jgi:hypothetical protein